MAIQSRETKMSNFKPTSVSRELWDKMVAEVPVDVAQQMVELSKQFVGFGKTGYTEIFYMFFFLAEGKTPNWLGGEEIPESAKAEKGNGKRAEQTPSVSQPAAPKSYWEDLL